MTGLTTVRALRRLGRQIAAGALLAGSLAGNLAHHHHALLATGEEPSHVQDFFITRHNPLSPASHWHAVIAVVHEQDCTACHNQRFVGFLTERHQPAPASSTPTATAARPPRALTASLLPSGSRAPPRLL